MSAPCAAPGPRNHPGPGRSQWPLNHESERRWVVRPHREVYEVDVPIHDTTNPARKGVHVFTGVADSPAAALRRAHEVYDAALAAHTAGIEIPGKQPDSWGARGLRPGWHMEWPAAKAGLWHSPVSWTTRSDFAL